MSKRTEGIRWNGWTHQWDVYAKDHTGRVVHVGRSFCVKRAKGFLREARRRRQRGAGVPKV